MAGIKSELKLAGILILGLLSTRVLFDLYSGLNAKSYLVSPRFSHPDWPFASAYLFILLAVFGPRISGFLKNYCAKIHPHAYIGFTGSLVVALIYLCIYNFQGFVSGPLNYNSTGDQGAYFRQYHGLLNGNLEASNYLYGMGYPLTAIVFRFINPENPFAGANLALYLGTMIATFSLAKHIFHDTFTAFGVTIFIALDPVVMVYTGFPWSSSVTLFTVTAASSIVIRQQQEISWPGMIGFGLLMGYTFSARYVDVVLFIPIGVYWCFRAFHVKGHRAKVFCGAMLATVIAILVFYSHYIYFGDALITPYKYHLRPEGGNDQDLSVYLSRLGFPQIIHLWGTFFDPTLAWDFKHDYPLKSIFMMSNLVILAPLGVVYCVKYFSKGWPLQFCGLLGLGLFLFIYSAHPGTYPGCLAFGSAHYFKAIVPLAIILAGFVAKEFATTNDAKRAFFVNTAAVMSILALVIGYQLHLFAPRQFKIVLDQVVYKPGETVHWRLNVKSRVGLTPKASALSDFKMGGILMGYDPVSKENVRASCQITQDKESQWVWHAACPLDPALKVPVWTVGTLSLEQPKIFVDLR